MTNLADQYGRWFPARRIDLHSDGGVHTLVLSGRVQACLAGAVVLVCAGLLAASATVGLSAMVRAGQIAAARAHPPALRPRDTRTGAVGLDGAAFADGDGATGPDAQALGELARTLKRRDAALGALLHVLLPGGTTPKGAAPGDKAQNAPRQLNEVRGEQVRLVAAAAAAARGRLERLRAAFRTARLDPVTFARDARPAGEGGPFIDASDPATLARALDVDLPFATGVARATADAAAAASLSRAARTAPLGLPVVDPQESSGFGLRADPFTGRAAFHPGQDFRGARGQPILAAASGVVAFTGQRSGYGNVLEIDHGHGFLTRYGHLSAFRVRRGQTVQAGQMIAAMGSTGRSTGVHLHYEVWQDGRLQDPDRFIRAARSVQP